MDKAAGGVAASSSFAAEVAALVRKRLIFLPTQITLAATSPFSDPRDESVFFYSVGSADA